MIDADVLEVARDLEAAKLAENVACFEAYATLRACEVAEAARVAARRRWSAAKEETERLQCGLREAALAAASYLSTSVGEYQVPDGYYSRLDAIRTSERRN